jgi:hypothetical protein
VSNKRAFPVQTRCWRPLRWPQSIPLPCPASPAPWPAMDVKQTHLGVVTLILSTINFICLFLPNWMHLDGDRDIGIFYTRKQGSDDLIQTQCTSLMSETECGYLQSVQVAAVVSFLFGICSSIVYFLPPKSYSALPTFVAVSGTCAHFIFSLMTTVIFYYFQADYQDNDDTNKEDDAIGSLNYEAAYFLWIIATVFSFMATVVGYRCIYKVRFAKGFM